MDHSKASWEFGGVYKMTVVEEGECNSACSSDIRVVTH